MTLPPVTLGSSFRIHDSLADGVSFFMAELRRLKQVVDLASECREGKQRTLFFLLDEILQGTNSKERHIAVQKVPPTFDASALDSVRLQPTIFHWPKKRISLGHAYRFIFERISIAMAKRRGWNSIINCETVSHRRRTR